MATAPRSSIDVDRTVPEDEAYVESVVASLTLEQKVRLLTGADFWSTHDEPTIGLRRMVVSDGPAGVRGEQWDERDPSVNLPSPTAWAATWDEELVERLAEQLAAEARRKGVHVVLGPTVNLHRSPLGGRHFECFSEDPLLSGRIGVAYVGALQRYGVGACPKHYVANDSETDRFTVDVRVAERTLRELYLAPFEQIVTATRPWMVMSAYNSVNGVTMTENDLLATPLCDEWGFDGLTVSDWTATRSTEASARAALHLAMPGPDGPWGDKLAAAVSNGEVPEAAIDEKVRRLLRLAARTGALEWLVRPGRPVPAPTRAETVALAREAAATAMVLVRNEDSTLPLATDELRRLAVIGPNADAGRTQGGGSATVLPPYTISPLRGLQSALADRVEVLHAVGNRPWKGLAPVSPEQATDPVSGEPGVRVRFRGPDGTVLHEEHRDATRLTWLGDPLVAQTAIIEVGTRFRAKDAGTYRLGAADVGSFRLSVDGDVVFDKVLSAGDRDLGAAIFDPPEYAADVDLGSDQEVELLLTHQVPPGLPVASLMLGVEPPARTDDEELAHAVGIARQCDAAVVVVGTTEKIESEGFDRASLALPGRQNELVRAVAAANPRTVVVVNSGGPVLLPWRHEVGAVLLSWFPGQEFGNALADVLLGAVEPGGRLPTTWPDREEDVPVLSTRPDAGVLAYDEGLHIGYRAWARSAARPAYAFGYGLGYTTWEIVDVEMPATVRADTALEVRVRVRNTGGRAGRDVVQVYLARPESSVERPARWLAGFAAVTAEAGAEATVAVRVESRSFAHWDDGWQVEPGEFEVRVGRSSSDLGLDRTVTVEA